MHFRDLTIAGKIVLVAMTFFVLFGGSCWYFADRILNDLLRPQIEQEAALALEAEVVIKELSWSPKGLHAIGLKIIRPDEFKLSMPLIEIDFSIAAIFQRHLDAVRIISPQIEIKQSQEQTTSTQSTTPFPSEFPLTIGRLKLTRGDISLKLTEKQIHLRGLTFQGALNQNFPFKLDGFIGPDNGNAFSLGGRLKLDPNMSLTLDRFDFQRRSLITQPFSIVFPDNLFANGQLNLSLANLDQQQLRDILTPFGLSFNFPKDINFDLSETQLSLNLQKSTPSLDLKIAAGQISTGEISLPFEAALNSFPSGG